MLLTQMQLNELFASLTNWQDRYRQLVQLSKTLPPFPEKERIEKNQIEGCENKVWVTYQQQSEQKLTFCGDSEGRIVKGLLAIILILVNNKAASEIIQIDFLVELKQLNILEQLSESRQLGIQNILDRIRQIALNLIQHSL